MRYKIISKILFKNILNNLDLLQSVFIFVPTLLNKDSNP